MILPGSHPFEYFSDSWDASRSGMPQIYHPEPSVTEDGSKGPLYFKITLMRSLIGIPWTKRYEAGVLFKKYSPLKRYKPGFVDPNLNTHTVVFREATPEVAKLILGLKEILEVENITSEDQYKIEAKKLLGRKAMTPQQIQEDRGYYVVK